MWTGRQGCRLEGRAWPGDSYCITEGKEAMKKAAAISSTSALCCHSEP
ncbi:hypothetical protein Nmel_009218 [Mimus melanotis]